ncbi:CAP-associated domain-containing protein, partial [Neobacillus drentensis]|uniref:CAP domain-containing protein n=1 Tax=Neobacillus drentensis TaxID=220684 RepID=UPI002FFFF9B3
LYTNQDLIASTNGIKLGSSKIDVRAKLGEPITNIQKGLTVYQLQENSDYDVFLLEGTYVTIFYDKHENNTVTAIQLISKDFEQKKTGFYTKANSALKEGFEYQLFDLTNAARVNHQLTVLTWDEHVRGTARKHSTDMAVHQYFDHTNLKGQSPFDRMKEDDISFHMAGENLAYGQFSSIFAHEGLMNSLGHRENILRDGYEFLGVGVAFNDESQPYYTENFFAK